MENKKTVRDIDLSDQRVLVRVDFNVPLDGTTVTDDTRIRAAIPTLEYIVQQKPALVILMSHLGRPKGTRNDEYSLKPTVAVLEDLLGTDVTFLDNTVGQDVRDAIAGASDGQIFMLENTRFNAGETDNDPDFSRQLADLADVFVDDAFGTAHRAHASNVGVAQYLPAVAGFLLEKEIEYLSDAIASPERPFVAILGGAKVLDKISVIEALIEKVDRLLIGGGMANTFNAAIGYSMANSLVEQAVLDTAKSLYEQHRDKIMLPVDGVVVQEFDNNAESRIASIEEGVPEGWESLDIGPQTVENFTDALQGARTVVWNGPMGVFEMPNFAKGTIAIAQALVDLTEQGATTIIGGGDSAAAVEQAGLADKMTHISTGGGASLEMLEGKALPGVEALTVK